jgi:hypothetical protein
MVPSWQAPGDPFILAAVVEAVTVACLWLTRWLGSRAVKFERTMLAGFLVGMPLVYVMGWFAARDHAATAASPHSTDVVGSSSIYAAIPGLEVPQVPGSCRWILRMAENG